MNHPLETQLLQALHDQKQMGLGGFAERFDIHPVLAKRCCQNLLDAGDIRYTYGGEGYTLTEQGRERLRDRLKAREQTEAD